MAGFPPEVDAIISVERGNHYAWPQLQWTFSNVQQLVPSKAIWRGPEAASTLELKSEGLDRVYIETQDGRRLSWQQANASTQTDGLAVLHKGKLIHEEYFGHCHEHSSHLIMSCAKSYAGLLAEMLIENGTLNEKTLIPEYLPELSHTAWQDASLRQVLDMLINMEFHEDYLDPASDVWKFLRAGGMAPGNIPQGDPKHLFEYLLTVNKQGEHGEAFSYREPNINVLTFVIQRVTQRDLKDLVSEYIWQHMGAEHDGSYMLDPAGMCTTASCTLRDFLRLGEFVRTGVSDNILQRLVSGGSTAHFSKAAIPAMQGWSYKSQWWVRHTPNGNAILARGAHGQILYIDPTNELVIARFASSKLSPGYLNDSVVMPMFDAITKQATNR